MRLPIFPLLRWTQRHPNVMRVLDLLFGLGSLLMGVYQGSIIWMIISTCFVIAAIFRLGERMNIFLPKITSPQQDKDA